MWDIDKFFAGLVIDKADFLSLFSSGKVHSVLNASFSGVTSWFKNFDGCCLNGDVLLVVVVLYSLELERRFRYLLRFSTSFLI